MRKYKVIRKKRTAEFFGGTPHIKKSNKLSKQLK